MESVLAEHNLRDSVKIIVVQISSDPSMRRTSRPRLLDAGNTCSVSTAGGNEKKNPLLFEDAAFDFSTLSSRGDDEGPEVNFLNELWSPLAGVMSTRESRGRAASEELAARMCLSRPGTFVHLAMCDPDPSVPPEKHIVPPLGWVLSAPSRNQIREILDVCSNTIEMDRLLDAMRSGDGRPHS